MKRTLKSFSLLLIKFFFFNFLGYFIISFTPISFFWFEWISGLSHELTLFALPAIQLMIIMPLLSVPFCWQKSMLIFRGQTKTIGSASILELFFVVSLLFLLVNYLRINSVLGIMISLISARVAALLYLVSKRRREAKRVLLESSV